MTILGRVHHAVVYPTAGLIRAIVDEGASSGLHFEAPLRALVLLTDRVTLLIERFVDDLIDLVHTAKRDAFVPQITLVHPLKSVKPTVCCELVDHICILRLRVKPLNIYSICIAHACSNSTLREAPIDHFILLSRLYHCINLLVAA